MFNFPIGEGGYANAPKTAGCHHNSGGEQHSQASYLGRQHQIAHRSWPDRRLSDFAGLRANDGDTHHYY